MIANNHNRLIPDEACPPAAAASGTGAHRALMKPSPRLDRIWRAPRWLPAARSLRTHVAILVLACIIPMVAFSAFAVFRYANAQREANDRQILNTARALSAAMD